MALAFYGICWKGFILLLFIPATNWETEKNQLFLGIKFVNPIQFKPSHREFKKNIQYLCVYSSEQAIQSEYDKLQDNLEKQKSDNKKISKNLETVVLDNASLKETLYEERETVARCKLDIERRTKEITSLENSLKNQQALVKKLTEEKKAEMLIREQREKDYESIKSKLEAEIQSHKSTRLLLDAAKQERTTNSVLSLEVDNYEVIHEYTSWRKYFSENL